MSVTIGKKIEAYRKLKGYKISDIANKTSTDNKTVRSWESGKTCPNEKELLSLCELFNVSYLDITGEKKNVKLDKKKIGLLDGFDGEVKSFDGKSIYSKLTIITLIVTMSLLIGGMIIQTFSSTKVGYFIGSVLVFLTSFTDILLYIFFILSKKRNDNFILFGLFLTLFIISEILLFIINFIPLFYLDFTTGYKEISKYFPIFYIVTIIKFNIFPYALKNDEKRPKNSKYLSAVYLEAVAVSLVGFYFLFQLGYIILTLGLIALIGAKENVNVRYFYFGFGAGRYVTYRDKEREILELKKENAYQEKEPISIKTHITNALLNLKENCTLKLTVLIMAVSVIALFDFSGLGQDYYPLILLSLLVIAILPISIYATINASKTVKISTLVLTVFGSMLLISSVVVLPLKIVSPYIIGFAPLITFATILLGYLSYLWSVDISKLAKIIITIIATILTLAFIMFTGGNIFENRYFIMPWIVYLTLNSLTVILTTKYVKNRSN